MEFPVPREMVYTALAFCAATTVEIGIFVLLGMI